jgi:prophage regulatory protein
MQPNQERAMSQPAERTTLTRGDRLLRLSKVKGKVALGSSTIYRRMSAETFPKPISLGLGTVRWKESEIEAWIVELSVQ